MKRANQLRSVRMVKPSTENHHDLYLEIENLYQLFNTLTNTLENLLRFKVPTVSSGVDFYREVLQFERSLIEQSLKLTGGCQKRSAELLNLKPTTLNKKIKVFNINWKESGAE